MLKLSFALALLFEGAQCGQYCKQYISEYTHSYSKYYCDGKCCGSLYDDDCCEDKGSYIAAAVIGSIIGFLVLATIIVCIIKACTRNCNGGRVIHPGPNMFMVSGASHYGRQQNNRGQGVSTIPQPPPYTAGPAPPYSPNGRKDRFPPRQSISSLPPPYTAGQPPAGTSSTPAVFYEPQPHFPQPVNPIPAGGPVVTNPDQHSVPPPAYDSLGTQKSEGSPPSQDPAARLPATAPVAVDEPTVTNPAGGNVSSQNQ